MVVLVERLLVDRGLTVGPLDVRDLLEPHDLLDINDR